VINRAARVRALFMATRYSTRRTNPRIGEFNGESRRRGGIERDPWVDRRGSISRSTASQNQSAIAG
jgi:hypothetical protein